MSEEVMKVERTDVDSKSERLQQALRAQANAENVPSGILIDSNARADELDAFDGSAHAPAVTQMEWFEAYALLASNAVHSLHGMRGDVHAEAEALRASGALPIFIADFVYERARPRWQAHLRRATEAEDGKSVLPPLSSLVTRGETFLASALPATEYDLFTPVNGRHYGLRATFVVPASGYKTNTGRTIESMELDFGDGVSRRVRPDEPVAHEFAGPGVKQLALSVRTSDGATRIARLALDVVESAPTPDAIWNLESEGARGKAWIYRSGGRPRLTRPVILAEGFPGGRTLDQLWPLVNQSNFVTDLRAKGYDFIILGFDDGTRAIGDNARVYRQCVQKVIAEKNNTEKIAAGGASMGGLIARYALCTMEQANIDHHVGVFFTVDTPHQGANIPVSVQAFVQLYATSSKGGSAKEPARLMASLGAQQMLLQWIPPYSEWRDGKSYPIASPERGKFLEDLRQRGWMPKKVSRRVGVADGLGTGVGNGVPAGAHTLWFECTAFYWANLYASQEGLSQIIDVTCGGENWKWQAGGARIDGAPGGTRTSWKELYDGLPGSSKKNAHPDHCFVPTVSACAVSAGLYEAIAGKPSELHAFKTSTTKNLGHIALPEELKKFLVDQITGASGASAQEEALQQVG